MPILVATAYASLAISVVGFIITADRTPPPLLQMIERGVVGATGRVEMDELLQRQWPVPDISGWFLMGIIGSALMLGILEAVDRLTKTVTCNR